MISNELGWCSLIGDNAKAIIANMSKNVRVPRALLINLYANYGHEQEHIKNIDGFYKTTCLYSFRYTPNEFAEKTRGKPFIFKIDLFDTIESGGHRVVDFQDFCNSEKYGKFVPFLLRYTNISEELFELARNNPCCDIPLQFDILKYIKDVKEKWEKETGEKLERFTFYSKSELARRDYLENEKMIHRQESRKSKLKGVVNR